MGLQTTYRRSTKPKGTGSNPVGRAPRAKHSRIHELLLEAIADDLDEPQGALRPRLVAAAAMAATTTAVEGSFDEKAEQRVPGAKAEALAVLDDAILFLRGGIDALQDK